GLRIRDPWRFYPPWGVLPWIRAEDTLPTPAAASRSRTWSIRSTTPIGFLPPITCTSQNNLPLGSLRPCTRATWSAAIRTGSPSTSLFSSSMHGPLPSVVLHTSRALHSPLPDRG